MMKDITKSKKQETEDIIKDLKEFFVSINIAGK